jgi:hypothetical protein
MAAPFGNQNAKGHGCGRPREWTDELIEAEAEAFYKWMEGKDNIYFKSFAIERGYLPSYLSELAERSIIFAECLKYAHEWQQQKLVNCGLFNKTNASITKFVLGNCHNWTESQQIVKETAKNSFQEYIDKEVKANDASPSAPVAEAAPLDPAK